jgi:hypothetical protein
MRQAYRQAYQERDAVSGAYVHGYHRRENDRLQDQAGTLVVILRGWSFSQCKSPHIGLLVKSRYYANRPEPLEFDFNKEFT